MAHPDLPAGVKAMLANEQHRTHHHLWHFVRSPQGWNGLTDTQRAQLTGAGWAAPRFNEEPGSGIDFLGMHRQMIAMTNGALDLAGDPAWPSVIGWDPIPWSDGDAEWPVPDWQAATPPWASAAQWQDFTSLAAQARSAARVAEMQELAARFRDPSRLETMSLDQLGIAIEWSIHGWMHMRWSGGPHDEAFATSPDNDWLFLPWSSHVNKTFWKLHGWIDERIGDWEAATGQQANLSQTWAGPSGVPGAMPHMADVELLRHLPPREEAPMPMLIREHIVEGLLK